MVKSPGVGPVFHHQAFEKDSPDSLVLTDTRAMSYPSKLFAQAAPAPAWSVSSNVLRTGKLTVEQSVSDGIESAIEYNNVRCLGHGDIIHAHYK